MDNSKTNKTAADALRDLVTESESRTKISRIRSLMPEIEAAKEAGIGNKKIVETLNAHGFDLTQKTFEMMLYRIRKSRKLNKNSKNPAALPQNKITPKEKEGAGKDILNPQVIKTKQTALPVIKKSEVNLEDYMNQDEE